MDTDDFSPWQVSLIDVTKESPCGHGTVICFSVYCGEGAHFGELVAGEPADGVVQNQLWVDTMADDSKDQVSAPARPLVASLRSSTVLEAVAAAPRAFRVCAAFAAALCAFETCEKELLQPCVCL
jgi:hypothetical protein